MLKFSSKNCPKKKHTVFLATLVCLGACLRFWDLGAWSFWKDEVFMILGAQQFSLANSPINPLPYLAVKLSITIAGNSEWGSRLIPSVVGILSIPLIFVLARALFNERVGLLASAFVAFSSWHLFWAQNARASYILCFFFATLTAWLFYIALEKDSTGLTIAAFFSCICLVLSHLLTVFMVPALATYAVLRLLEASNRKRWLNLLLFFAPFALPILTLLHPQIRGYLFSGWGLNEWSRSPFYIVLTLVQGISIPVAVTAFIGAFSNGFNRQYRFLICYAGVPFGLFLIASQFQNVAGYYLFWTTPSYFILAGTTCNKMLEQKQTEAEAKTGGKLFALLVPSILLVNMAAQDYLYFTIENGGRPKWREAFEAVRPRIKRNDKVLLSVPEMGRYYLPQSESIYIGGLLNDADAFEDNWKAERHRLWFLVDVANFNVFDADDKVRNWIRQRGRFVDTLPTFSRAKDRTIHVYLVE